MLASIRDTFRKMYRSLRLFKIDREFLVFLVFLIVSVVFWFLQTFKETTSAYTKFPIRITGIPQNVILTSEVPEKITAAISGRGFAIVDYLTKTKDRTIEIDFSTYRTKDGVLVVDNNAWKRLFSTVLGNSVNFVSVNPSILEIYFSEGAHKYVPIVFAGKAKAGPQHVLSGINIEPSYVDIYAPEALFDTISEVRTEPAQLGLLKDTTTVRLALEPPKGVKCVPDSVDAIVCVDLFTTKSLTLPIFSENMPQDKILRTFPLKAKVTFRVSSTLYNQITENDFALVVDYNTIRPEDKKCQLIMRSQPEGISDIQISPSSVDYIIEQE